MYGKNSFENNRSFFHLPFYNKWTEVYTEVFHIWQNGTVTMHQSGTYRAHIQRAVNERKGRATKWKREKREWANKISDFFDDKVVGSYLFLLITFIISVIDETYVINIVFKLQLSIFKQTAIFLSRCRLFCLHFRFTQQSMAAAAAAAASNDLYIPYLKTFIICLQS